MRSPQTKWKNSPQKADFTVERIHEIERETNHDVIAFVTNVAEYAGDVARHFHFGLTSSDVLDTAGALQLRNALDLILDEAKNLTLLLAEMSLAHGDTVMVGQDARGSCGADDARAQAGGVGLRDGAEPG